MSDLDSLSLLNSLCGFFCLITRPLFVCLTRSCTCCCALYDLHDGTEFTRCVFPTYTLHVTFDPIVNLSLQSTICVNCSSPNPLSKNCPAASSLFFFSSAIESPCLVGQTTSSGFTPINSVLRSLGTKSSSPIVHRKKAGDK